MAPKREEQGSGLAGAAGRAALRPARAAARAWRGPIEEAAEQVLASPELGRILDRALAGPLPEELTRSLVRHRVLERVVGELAESGELERLVSEALASPRTLALTDTVLASDEMQNGVRRVASSPELREAVTAQTRGLAEEVVGDFRASAVALDDRAEHLLRRPARAGRPVYAGVATRAGALTVDAAANIVLFMAGVGIVALVGSLVGGIRPTWLVGLLLAWGYVVLAGAYFTLFWTATGQTPGMRLFHLRVLGADGSSVSIGRAALRVVGLVLATIPLFAGFLPVLFTERRRGLPDYLARTVVVYDDRRPATSGGSPG
jgi:uncharacterized RDD family membrane protein YckC